MLPGRKGKRAIWSGRVTAAAICGAAVRLFPVIPRPLPELQEFDGGTTMSARKPPAISAAR